MLTHLSLFSGIGGIDLAAEWAGFKTIAFCEIDPFCQKVLKKHWHDVPIIEDVKDVTRETVQQIMADTRCQHDEGQLFKREYEKEISEGSTVTLERSNSTSGISGLTIISGGFPCQPHSVAGKHKGSADERNLWPEFRRIIGEIKPRWVLAENVPGLFSSDSGRFFGSVLTELASLGYSVGWSTYGAVDVGALHRRNRVFIVSYANNAGLERRDSQLMQECACEWIARPSNPLLADSKNSDRWRTSETEDNTGRGNQKIRGCGVPRIGSEYWKSEPNVGRVAHGIPRRVDRLKSLGNAVVPQQIYPILKVIADIERDRVGQVNITTTGR